MRLLTVFTIFAALCGVAPIVDAGKTILCLMLTFTRDGLNWNEAFYRELLKANYDLIVVTPELNYEGDTNRLKFIPLEGVMFSVKSSKWGQNSNSYYRSIFDIADYGALHLLACEGALKSRGLQYAIHTINERRKDIKLILYDMSYGISCLITLVQLLPDVPVVGVSSYRPTPQLLSGIRGSISQPSYVPFYTTDYGSHMTFWERAWNSVHYDIEYIIRNYYQARMEDAVESLNNTLRLIDEDLRYRIKVVLINSFPSMRYWQLLPPNVFEVGGMDVKRTQLGQAFTYEIDNFLNRYNVSNLIVMDVGAYKPGFLWTQKNTDTVIRVIETLPDFGFIWQTGNQILLNHEPMNLFAAESLPLMDLLSHRFVRAFVTHASHVSYQSALMSGVPIVAVPLQADEFNNAEHAVRMGNGISIPIEQLTKPKLTVNIIRFLDTELLKENSTRARTKSLTRVENPLELALHHIDQLVQQPWVFDHLTADYYDGYFAIDTWMAHSGLFIILILLLTGMAFIFGIYVFKNAFKEPVPSPQLSEQELDDLEEWNVQDFTDTPNPPTVPDVLQMMSHEERRRRGDGNGPLNLILLTIPAGPLAEVINPEDKNVPQTDTQPTSGVSNRKKKNKNKNKNQ